METIQIDKAGRVVLPKGVRRSFNLNAGDKLRLVTDEAGIRLEPVAAAGELVRKGNVLVFRGEFSEPITTELVNALITEDREYSAPIPKLKPRKK